MALRKKKSDMEEFYDVKYEDEHSEYDSGEAEGQSRVMAFFGNRRNRIILFSALGVIFLVSLILCIVFSVKSCSGSVPVDELYSYNTEEYKTNTRVQYAATTKGTVERVKPVEGVKDESSTFSADAFNGQAKRYPTYGSTLSYVIGTDASRVAARSALIQEANYLAAWGTASANSGGEQTADKYTIMDKDGWLYQIKDGERVHSLLWGKTEYVESNYRRLYKHSASEGLYLGDIADDEKAVVKELTLRNRSYNSYSVTGVYAPAGEVIKIEMSDADMKSTGGITIHIGQALYNGQANNIWTEKNQMQRFPILLTTMVINQTTAQYDEKTGIWTGYVGSFIGGPIYIRNNSATFNVTISGGIPYSHFILGYTTEKEFEQNSKTSVPYFDLEVWDRGVLHSGPKKYAEAFDYEDLYKVAVLWDKVASVTTTGSNQGIVFLYDPFVAAGAAVAFPGRSSVNCPMSWMPSSLNYDAIVTSGSWGNFHEYHHNFQGYGVGDGGEVTNNGMTLVSYALFTKISAKRGIGNIGAQGLGDWNNYTSATWALEEVNKIGRANETPGNGNKGLALYATLLHNFGADNYINAKVAGGGQSYAAYMDAWQKVTHNNMYYYFNDVLKGTGLTNNANSAYPTFVPASSVYQTGRSYLYYNETTGQNEKRYFDTMQPYVIPYGSDFTVDLRAYSAPDGQYAQGSVVLPDGLTFKIEGVTQPENGSIIETDTPGVYTYRPDTSKPSLRSGKFNVTISIYKDGTKFVNEPIDLVLEFEQSHETNKMVLQRTTYTYSAGNMYSDAVEAYGNNFAKYDKVEENWDHKNPTQNCNTDIWFYPDNAANREKYPNVPESYFVHENTIEVISGKLYAAEDGKYRVYLRGRSNCAVYYSFDDKDYKLGATVKNGSGDKFYPSNADTYFDVEFKEGSVYVDDELVKSGYEGVRWIYFKEVLIVQTTPYVSYIGLGMTQWTVPLYTTSEDANGVTHYYDANNKEVTAEQASNVDPIAPKNGTFVNAYRATYQFPDNKSFETDYFYVRNYSYSYTDNLWQNQNTEDVKQELISTNYAKNVTWDQNDKAYPSEALVDGNRNTFIHTNFAVTESRPIEFVVDMGEAKPINRMVIYTQYRGGNGDWLCPRQMTLEGSLDGENFFLVSEISNDVRNTSMTFNFEEKTFRYYRLTVTRSDRLLIIAEIEMWRIFEINGGKHISPDNEMFAYGGAWGGAQTVSNFGHVSVGVKGSTVNFEFEGTRLGILTSKEYGSDIEVRIDGKRVESFELKEDDFATSLTYLSGELEQGKHSVTVRCNGTAGIDSFVIFP